MSFRAYTIIPHWVVLQNLSPVFTVKVSVSDVTFQSRRIQTKTTDEIKMTVNETCHLITHSHSTRLELDSCSKVYVPSYKYMDKIASVQTSLKRGNYQCEIPNVIIKSAVHFFAFLSCIF